MEKFELVRKIPVFRDLTDTDIERLIRIATEETFAIGEQVFTEGSPGDALFVIKYGTVQVLKTGDEEEEEVSRMSIGQHFGEMALIDNHPRSATVVAVEHTELIKIRREDLENLIAEDNAFASRFHKAFCQFLCHRLRQTTNDLTFMRDLARRRGERK